MRISGIKAILNVKKFGPEDQGQRQGLCNGAYILIFLCLAVFVARLWYLQIINGEEFREKSERNKLRIVRLQPPRGKILDRNGRLLAGVKPCFNICIVRKDVKNMEALLGRLLPLLNEQESSIRVRLKTSLQQPGYIPAVIKRDAQWDEISRVEARLSDLPGVIIEVTPGRKYPYGSIAPHLLGYLGELSQADIDAGRFPEARPGDLVGKYGVEARFQSQLAGIKGERKLEVDSRMMLKRVVSERRPVAGDDVYLTIDVDLQMAAEEGLGEKVGAVVALEPSSGRILAMASTPKFDPEAFARGVTVKEWKILNDPLYRPMRNKAIQEAYAPGSTFKIVMASAALQEKVVDESTQFFCNGSFKLGRRTFRCWDWRGHGQTNIYKAIVQSCDVYFYNVGLKLGVDRIGRYARGFGLGKRTGIDLPGEQRGLVPTREWKKKRYHEAWQKGETLNISIGQGFVLTTPIQMANLISSVANGGDIYRPGFLEKIVGPDAVVHDRFSSDKTGHIPVSHRNLNIVRNALKGVVQDRRGTARRCRIKGIEVAGKTGTAQVIKQTKRRQSEKMDWKYRDHAWFVAYAPADSPRIAVAVLVEHGGHGGSAAAPIAKLVIERWLQLISPKPVLMPQRRADAGKSQGTGSCRAMTAKLPVRLTHDV